MGKRPSKATAQSRANTERLLPLILLLNRLNTQDSDLLDSISQDLIRTSGMQPGSDPDAVYIIAESASEIQSQAHGREHSAEINFETKYGPFQSAVELANLTVRAYALGFDGSCGNFTMVSKANGYAYGNPSIVDPLTGGPFSRDVLDKDERGEEYTNRGMALLPDSIVWSQSGPYEWHPYISKVFKAPSLRNKFPTFMVRAPPTLLSGQPRLSSSLPSADGAIHR